MGSHFQRLFNKSSQIDKDIAWANQYREWRIAIQNERYVSHIMNVHHALTFHSIEAIAPPNELNVIFSEFGPT
jgi:hypothetical protein